MDFILVEKTSLVANNRSDILLPIHSQSEYHKEAFGAYNARTSMFGGSWVRPSFLLDKPICTSQLNVGGSFSRVRLFWWFEKVNQKESPILGSPNKKTPKAQVLCSWDADGFIDAKCRSARPVARGDRAKLANVRRSYEVEEARLPSHLPPFLCGCGVVFLFVFVFFLERTFFGLAKKGKQKGNPESVFGVRHGAEPTISMCCVFLGSSGFEGTGTLCF